MPTNFAACDKYFRNNDTAANLYRYRGPVAGAYTYLNSTNLPLLITVEGCRAVCGTGADPYEWPDASATISTWILPMIGLMLQALYESNEFVSTMFFMARMVGSPIATMSYILWNMKVSAICALMIDMSTAYDDFPGQESQFEQMRDSFYLLSVMNQYSIKQRMPREEAERLLRIALFSDSLQLEGDEEESTSLPRRRRKLARTIRESRKRGVVPVFVTLLWFLFSLIVSLQAAFGQLGENATAHNLALGLLLSWLPSLILFSVVDRNPIAADAIRIKLNRLLDATRRALLDPSLRDTYIRDIGRSRRDFAWTNRLSDEDYFHEDFFTQFAGQGRVRWHYGVAPPILAGIESTPITKWGRGWLDDGHNGDKARTILVKGPEELHGLHWFDKRSFWQVFFAYAILSASIGGAGILSYFTPTVGLGCRSGGYMVYFILAFLNLLLEGLCWIFIDEGKTADVDPVTTLLTRVLPEHPEEEHRRDRILNHVLHWWEHLNIRQKIEMAVLRPLDVVTSVWLSYIVLSQVFGWYRTCDCQSSMWTPLGGYMDFKNYKFYRDSGVGLYWGGGTALASVALGLCFAYAIVEWGQQSHMSTDNYEAAQQGLETTRKFRKCMEPINMLYWRLALLPSRLTPRTCYRLRPLREFTRVPMIWTSSRSKSLFSSNLPRAPTIEVERGTAMSRDVSRDTFGNELDDLNPRERISDPGLGLSLPPESSAHGHTRSPGSSFGETDWGATMSRDASRSSQGIERKPLLRSAARPYQRSPSIELGDEWQPRSTGMSRDASANSVYEHALMEYDFPLPPLEQSHPRVSRLSFGDRDLHPPPLAPPPRSEPRARSGSSRGTNGSSAASEDLELPASIPRSQAY